MENERLEEILTLTENNVPVGSQTTIDMVTALQIANYESEATGIVGALMFVFGLIVGGLFL